MEMQNNDTALPLLVTNEDGDIFILPISEINDLVEGDDDEGNS